MPYFEQPGRYTKMDRKKIPAEDFGDPANRKYPIVVPADVQDAARLIGKAGDPEAVKKQIVDIAKRKGKEFVDMLPLAWRQEFKLADEPAPGNLKIPFFRLGKWKHPLYGPIEGTQEKFDAIKANFKRNVLGRPPYVRLGHTRDGAVTYGDTPAEAWVYDIIQEDNVLYALAHPTSGDITEAVNSKRYRFASPEYDENYIDKENGQNVGTTLLAIGLTNEPFLTRLPAARALAEHADIIYHDYEEVKGFMENDITKKLSEFFSKLFEGLKMSPAPSGGLTDEERKKLAEVDELKTKLAAAETTLAQTVTKLAQAETNTSAVSATLWTTQVESRLNALVAKGIPPVMCDQAKAFLLSMPAAATTMVKLADNKEISLAEQVFGMLEALPETQRVKMSQSGSQETQPPADSPEAIKKLADEDVKAMGGKITEDGKYIL